MSTKTYNEWENPIDQSKLKETQNYNLEDIYDHAHSELSLQQSKRDQIMTIYLALTSFILPFALREEMISMGLKGLIFIVLSIVGILFSFIAVRYREYKEVYWLCCQTITVLESFRADELNKSVVQSTFHHCIRKKGKGYLVEKSGGVYLNRRLFVKKNVFSSETMHYVIIVIMACFIGALGVALLCPVMWLGIVLGVLAGAALFLWLLSVYFKTCMKIYMVLEKHDGLSPEKRDKAFNTVFSKAWFLHFYYDKK